MAFAGPVIENQGLRTVTARAGDMEQLLEAAAALAARARTLPNGLPVPLDFVLFLRHCEPAAVGVRGRWSGPAAA